MRRIEWPLSRAVYYINGHRSVPRPTGDRSPSPPPEDDAPGGGRHAPYAAAAVPNCRHRRRRPRRRDRERVNRFCRAVSVVAVARTTCVFFFAEFGVQNKPNPKSILSRLRCTSEMISRISRISHGLKVSSYNMCYKDFACFRSKFP